MILIVGATSQPGQKLVPMLLGKGYQVRVLARNQEKADPHSNSDLQVVPGDLRIPDSLQQACQGVEEVVSCVTAAAAQGNNNIHTVDGAGNRALIDAARQAGARHFVLVSVYSAASNHPVDLMRVKYRAEEYLRASGLNYTILHPTAFMDSWCARLGAQVKNGAEVTIFGDGSNPINFISAEDVARFIVFALEDPRLRNQTLTIGGPQNLTLDEVVSAYERHYAKKVSRKCISDLRLKLTSLFSAVYNENQARFMAMRHDLATSNWQVDMTEVIKHYPINLVSLDDFISRSSTH